MIGLRWRLLGKNPSQQISQLCKAGQWNCWLRIVHGRLIKPPICYSEYKFWLLFPKIILLFGAAAKKKSGTFIPLFVCLFIHLFVHLYICACNCLYMRPTFPPLFLFCQFPILFNRNSIFFLFFFNIPVRWLVGGWLVLIHNDGVLGG